MRAGEWCDGIISQERVREEFARLDANVKGQSLPEIAETQHLIAKLAGFVNSIVPANSTAATLNNLRHAADWLAKTTLTLSWTKTQR